MSAHTRVIAKLVEAGHFDLADRLVDVVTSGVIKYPPQMYEAIRKWLMNIYGSAVADLAGSKVSRLVEKGPDWSYNEMGRLKETGDSGAHKKQLAAAESVYAAAVKLAGSKLLKKTPKTKTKVFKVDLKGLDKNKYPIAEMTKLTSKIPVTFNYTSPASAAWRNSPVEQRGITVDVPFEMTNVSTMREFSKTVATLDSALQHELQHMVQSLIADSIGKSSAREKLKNIPDSEQYWLDPAEFHTWILSSKNELLKMVMKSRPDAGETLAEVRPTRKEFNGFVGNPRPVEDTFPFFKSLHQYDRPRWKLAMREFYRIMAPLMDRK
jgi:hypothetical protein